MDTKENPLLDRKGLIGQRLGTWHLGLWLVGFALLAGMGVRPATAQVATDTTLVLIEETPDHSPRGALWRAAVVPGWGQLYNRQYLKIPVVYLGFAGFIAGALLVNDRYLLYRHAFLFTARTDTAGVPVFPQYADDYARLIERLGLPPESQLTEEEIASRRQRLEPGIRATRDNLRRNRDLLYIGTGLWYGLTLLDAYVSAHLMDFDVSEDLTLSLRPDPGTGGWTATLRLGL